jgi:hypothetical protein
MLGLFKNGAADQWRLVPWQRKAAIVGSGIVALLGCVIFSLISPLPSSSSTCLILYTLVLFWGITFGVLHKLLGRMDFLLFHSWPKMLFGWGHDASRETAEAWWLYVALVWISAAWLNLAFDFLRETF